MNPMKDAFKNMRKGHKSSPIEGSPAEEKGESQAQEDKEQQQGIADHAPSLKDHMPMSGAPHVGIPIHGDQMHGEHALTPEMLHTILSKLLAGSTPSGGGGFDTAIHAGLKNKLKV